MKTAEEIRNGLAQCYGSMTFTRHWMGQIVYTEGVAYLLENADCFWLMDAIASYRRKEEFQVWKLTVDAETHTAVLTMVEDSGKPTKVRQEIEYTDFPLDEIEIWVEYGSVDGVNPVYVAMLPSER